MAAAVAVIVLLPLFFTSAGCRTQDVHAILLKVVDAVEKLIKFYRTSYQSLNLDGLFGLKVIEGQVQRIIDEHGRGQHANLSPLVVQRLNTILQDAKWIAKHAIDVVQASDESYFHNLEFVVSQPWKHLKPHRRVVPTYRWEIPVYKSADNSKLEEGDSDKCMMEIIQPKKTNAKNDNQPSCSMSEDCAQKMTKRGLTEYGITHQLLWTGLAEKAGCSKELEALLKMLGFTSIDNMQEEFCSNNYYEMLAVVHVFMLGRVHGNYQDMFLEQQFVCPNLGFFEFLKKDYLDQILSWQMPSGCFGINSEKDSTLHVQSPQKLPPKMDLKKLGISDKLKNLSKVSSLDFRKQQMQQQLKNLKSSNQLIQSMLQIQDSERGRQDKDHQKHQKLNEEGIGDPWNPDQRRIKRLDFGDTKPQEAQLPHKRNQPKQQSPLDNPFHNVNTRNRPQGNMPYRPGDSVPSKHQGIVPNRPQVDQARVQGSWANNPQGVDAFGVQRMARSRDAAPAQGTDSAGQIQMLQVRGAGQHPQHPGVSVLGNRLQGRRMLSAYETGQGTKRKLLVEKEMPGGCLSHKTAVGSGALVMYLRYLIDPGQLDLFAPHNFLPDGPRGLLGDDESNKNVMNYIGSHIEDFLANVDFSKKDALSDGMVGFDGQTGERAGDSVVDEGEDDEDEEEEEDDEDGEYDDRDEMYPDTGGGVGQQHERKVVHFGANDNTLNKGQKKEDYSDKEDKNDEYADENEEEEEEEEGADYIKRGKGDDEGAAVANVKEVNEDDDTEYTYYDDDDNTERGIIKRHKPQPPPQNGARIRTHSRHKPHPAMIDNVAMSQADSPPTKAVVMLLGATSVVLVIFMCRFIKKRRIHIRYHNRSFFKL